MPRFETLLFDADNTLFDFSRAEKNALTDTLNAFGVVPTEALIASYSRINDEMWRRLERGEITKEALRTARFAVFCSTHGFAIDETKMAVFYMDALSKQTVLVEGALEVCQRLSAVCRMYIVTNGIKSVQTRRFAASALKEYFLDVFISEEIGYAKPDKRFFERCFEKIECKRFRVS